MPTLITRAVISAYGYGFGSGAQKGEHLNDLDNKDLDNKVGEGAATGAASGGAVGGLTGLLVGFTPLKTEREVA